MNPFLSPPSSSLITLPPLQHAYEAFPSFICFSFMLPSTYFPLFCSPVTSTLYPSLSLPLSLSPSTHFLSVSFSFLIFSPLCSLPLTVRQGPAKTGVRAASSLPPFTRQMVTNLRLGSSAVTTHWMILMKAPSLHHSHLCLVSSAAATPPPRRPLPSLPQHRATFHSSLGGKPFFH